LHKLEAQVGIKRQCPIKGSTFQIFAAERLGLGARAHYGTLPSSGADPLSPTALSILQTIKRTDTGGEIRKVRKQFKLRAQ